MKQEEREKEHQESLKERYDIEEDVVVVEKNNTIKFLLKTMIGGARLIIAILVFILALIGLTALIYPLQKSVNTAGTAGVAGVYETVIKGM